MSILNSELFYVRDCLRMANPTANVSVKNWYNSRFEDILIIEISGIKPEEFRLPEGGTFLIGIRKDSTTGAEKYSLWTDKPKTFIGMIYFNE